MKEIVFAVGVCVSAIAFAEPTSPSPFLEPLKTLKRSDAQFSCREPGDLNGIGGQVARFKLALIGDTNAITVKDVQIGDQSRDGTVSNWYSPAVDFSKGYGSVYFADRPQYERVNYKTTYNGPNRPGESPVGRIVSFEVTQDISTKLVFARYKDIAVLERAAPGCGQTEAGCSDSTETIFDNVYLCDYNP